MDSQEREILNLAALGLAFIFHGPERMLCLHRRSADGRCSECGQPWRCRFALIAVRAQEFLDDVGHAVLRTTHPATTLDHDPFKFEAPPDVVPPVLGLDDE
jgi:hypothetical protein